MITKLNSCFGKRIKSERQRVKMNQAQMAELGGVTRRSQVFYELGLKFPDAGYLVGIADKVDVLYIVTVERTPDGIPKALDARVIEPILAAIDAWAEERKKPVSIQVRTELLALFLKQTMAPGGIDSYLKKPL